MPVWLSTNCCFRVIANTEVTKHLSLRLHRVLRSPPNPNLPLKGEGIKREAFPAPAGRAMIPGIMDPTLAPFDRHRLRQHRDRAASKFQQHDFLFKDVAERLADFARRFETALDLGCHGGELGRALMPIGKIDRLVQSDISASMARL